MIYPIQELPGQTLRGRAAVVTGELCELFVWQDIPAQYGQSSLGYDRPNKGAGHASAERDGSRRWYVVPSGLAANAFIPIIEL